MRSPFAPLDLGSTRLELVNASRSGANLIRPEVVSLQSAQEAVIRA